MNYLKMPNNVNKKEYIVSYILENIQAEKIEIGDLLPSINEMSEHFGVSAITVIGAYKELKERGVIKSSPRKGFRVVSTNTAIKHKIFLLLDEFNGFKEVLYNSIKESIGRNGSVDVFFHHFNARVYKNIIEESIGSYTSYVIMPIPQKKYASVLKLIPEGKLYVLDIGLYPYGKMYPSVCQNFEKDMISALTSGLDLLKKYQKIILVYPDTIKTQQGMVDGFNYFCKQHKISNERINSALGRRLTKRECYLVIYDNDLVHLVNSARSEKLELGTDVGIISYDDTPLKPIVANGITTISTDFKMMGATMANMVINRNKDHIENPCYLLRRGSL